MGREEDGEEDGEDEKEDEKEDDEDDDEEEAVGTIRVLGVQVERSPSSDDSCECPAVCRSCRGRSQDT